MAPKNKGGDKKGKGKDADGGDKGKGLKPANSINVRHILVRILYLATPWDRSRIRRTALVSALSTFFHQTV
jgi:hypothetical protein